jgi:hypothetical protein
MTSLVLRDLIILESLRPSVNAPLKSGMITLTQFFVIVVDREG